MACSPNKAHSGRLFWHVFDASDDFAGLVAAVALLAVEAKSLVFGWSYGGDLGGIQCSNYGVVGKNSLGTLDHWSISNREGIG